MATDAMAPLRRRRGAAWWLLGIGLALFIFLSIRPVMRLRPNPPTGFVETRPEWDSKRRAQEERAARAYWEHAVRVEQWKYAFGTPLPDASPADFNLEEKGFPQGSFETSPATRARYWQKLREVWVLPQAWDKRYEWSTAWALETLVAWQLAARRFVDDLLGRFRT